MNSDTESWTVLYGSNGRLHLKQPQSISSESQQLRT